MAEQKPSPFGRAVGDQAVYEGRGEGGEDKAPHWENGGLGLSLRCDTLWEQLEVKNSLVFVSSRCQLKHKGYLCAGYTCSPSHRPPEG